MQWLRSTWRNLFRKHAVDNTLDEEIRSYLQLLVDEKIAAGADSETARREAAIELGAIEMIKEQVRDIRRGALLEGLWTELRQSIRALRHNPGMAAMCALMLALGIGSQRHHLQRFRSGAPAAVAIPGRWPPHRACRNAAGSRHERSRIFRSRFLGPL